MTEKERIQRQPTPAEIWAENKKGARVAKLTDDELCLVNCGDYYRFTRNPAAPGWVLHWFVSWGDSFNCLERTPISSIWHRQLNTLKELVIKGFYEYTPEQECRLFPMLDQIQNEGAEFYKGFTPLSNEEEKACRKILQDKAFPNGTKRR